MKNAGKILAFAALAVAVAAGAASCIRDSFESGTPEVTGRVDKAKVRFQISTPTMPATRAVTYINDLDNVVVNACVLVLTESEGGGYEYSYMLEPEITSGADGQATFDAELEGSDEPVKIVVVANYLPEFAEYLDTCEGMSEEALRKGYAGDYDEMTRINSMQQNVVPMVGEKVLPSLNSFSGTTVDIPLVRSLARVHITKNLLPDSGDFELTGVYLFRANTRVQLMPNPDAFDDVNPLRVAAPSTPDGWLPRQDALYASSTDVDGDVEFSQVLYVPESVAGDANGVTCIVVEGSYDDGIEVRQCSYRLDFGQGTTLGQVLRNHRYTFNITKVLGPGETNRNITASGPANSIVVEKIDDTPFDYVYFPDGGDEITIDQRSVVLGPEKIDQAIIVQVRSPRPFSWELEGADAPANQSTQENEYIKVDKGMQIGDVAMIFISTKQRNDTGAPFTGRIRISSGSVTGYIDWTQLSI